MSLIELKIWNKKIQLTLLVFLIEKMDPVEIFGIMIFSLYFDSAYWYLDRTC